MRKGAAFKTMKLLNSHLPHRGPASGIYECTDARKGTEFLSGLDTGKGSCSPGLSREGWMLRFCVDFDGFFIFLTYRLHLFFSVPYFPVYLIFSLPLCFFVVVAYVLFRFYFQTVVLSSSLWWIPGAIWPLMLRRHVCFNQSTHRYEKERQRESEKKIDRNAIVLRMKFHVEWNFYARKGDWLRATEPF